MHKTEVRVLVYSGEPEWVDRAPELSYVQDEFKAARGCITSTWLDRHIHNVLCCGDHVLTEAGKLECLPHAYRIEQV